jgi:NADH dehydrogenase
MKTVENARHLRDAILLAFEMAEIATDPVERAEWLTFVVIGAGPTGVELVGQVAELAHKVLPRDYRTVNTKEAKILLLEGAGAVLGPFPEKLREYSRKKLESMGVDVRLNTLAVDMDDESITVKGPDGLEVIRTRTRIWAAGVQASPLAKLLAQKAGLEVDRAGRIPVQPDCTVAGHPEVFALGDMVALNNLPGVAQPAMQEGKYVGKLIAGRLSGDEKVEPFKYFDKGNMATIGHRSAIADAFGMKFTGVIGYTMWGFIHVLYLIGWGNRLGTIYTWARALTFSRNRGHRLITFDDARGFSQADPPSHVAAPPDNARELGASAAPPDNARDGGPAAARRVSPEGAPAGAPPSGPDR